VKGGSKRFISVQHGLEFVNSPGLVAIHDGVRPLVRNETIKRCFETAGKYGNAIPVISPADSLRLEDDKGNTPVNRMYIKQVQTPQVFDVAKIKKAYLQDFDPSFTDDATVLEKTGEKIHLVEGNRENIKITNPEDLFIAQTLLSFIS
jgi:2-C-methyl-D-erythritol 4-phosphate cytidylyltransferase